jgi:hypothetical protein
MRANLIKQAGWMSPRLLGVLLLALMTLGTISARAAADEDSTFDNVDVVDASLKGKLAVLRTGGEMGPTKLLSIFVALRNKTGHPLELEIETIYKDGYGNALNSGSWISFTLKPHEDKEYHSTSISELATADSEYLVRVRAAQPSHG